jgi:hypothetical protein
MKKLVYITLFGCATFTVNAFSTELPPIVQLVKKTLEQRKLLSLRNVLIIFIFQIMNLA